MLQLGFGNGQPILKTKQVQTIPKSFNMEESQPLGKVSTRELFPSGHFLIRKLPLLKSSEFYIYDSINRVEVQLFER